ncbi:hypothetical protein [Frankia gtarii]|uniref:hypothetical protein n=1 Tax=Frankia gtarii TaxID=2950102 RepID=UPI0021BDFFFA|nr:hypothetical protein [Frankia gtarii]
MGAVVSLLVAPLVLALFVLAGCGGGDSVDSSVAGLAGAAASPSGDPMLAYAGCMRQHGVAMADPQAGEPASLYQGVDTSSVAFTSADKACAGLLAGVVAQRKPTDPGAQQELNDKLQAVAACLRQYGITVADPVPGQSGGPFGGQLDRNEPAVSTALQSCQQPGGGASGAPAANPGGQG